VKIFTTPSGSKQMKAAPLTKLTTTTRTTDAALALVGFWARFVAF
jgi:hypothetical protein